jgi:hypothetical protein
MHDAARNMHFQPLQLERYIKRHIVRVGAAQVCRSGGCNMSSRDEYLLRAAELSALAQVETYLADKLEFENLARSYLRLAEQAERNDQAYKAAQKRDHNQTPDKTPSANGDRPDDQIVAPTKE